MGQTRLVGKSGQRAKLTRTNGDKQEMRYLEVEPTVGESDELIDMQLAFSDEADPQRTTHLNLSVTLNGGKPLELITGAAGDGEKGSVRMKAEVLRGIRNEGTCD